jgi:hypothetical protein
MRFGRIVERLATVTAAAVVAVAAVPVAIQFAVDHSWRVHQRAHTFR